MSGTNPEAIQVVVDTELETDSAYADDSASFTTSLKSSALDYRYELGRRYAAFRPGRHLLPNDEQEQDRMDLTHSLIMFILESNLFLAPLQNPQRIIDLGTGTGIWAIDFADAHPDTHVMGNDLSPIQPQHIPPNVEFLVDDIEDDWGYENNPFDFVHARALAGSIKDWPKLMREAYKCTKPGGWVEFQDWDTMIESHDNSIGEDTPLMKWHRAFHKRMDPYMTVSPGPKLEKWIRDAGFINVTVKKFAVPLNVWPKDKRLKRIGILNMTQLEAGLEGISIGTLVKPVADEPAWSMDEIHVLLAGVRADMRNRQFHGQYAFYVVYGQKPE